MDTKYLAEQHKFAASKLERQVENALIDLKVEDRLKNTYPDMFQLGKRSYLVQLGTPGYAVQPAVHPRDRVFNLIMSGLSTYCSRSIDDLSIPRYVAGLHNELEKFQYNDGVVQDFWVGWLGANDYRVEARAIGILHSWRISFRTDGVLVSEERP